MNILITGGSGYIGGRLANFFASSNHEVHIASRRFPSDSVDSRVKFHMVDWNDESSLGSLVKGIDVIIHCAGMNKQDCQSNPVAAFEFNGYASARLAKAAKENNVKQFLYFSTVHVYSSNLCGTISEKTPTNNDHPYALSHLLGESLIAKEIGGCIDTRIIRLANSYGVPAYENNDAWNLMVNDFAQQARKSNRIVIEDNPKKQINTIPMVLLIEVIDSILKARNQKCVKIYNIGTGKSRSIIQIAESIKMISQELFGDSVDIIINPNKIEEVDPWFFESSRISFSAQHIELCVKSELSQLLLFCEKNNKTVQ